jgi:Spy/CpxP family protein refolding chaperone
MKTNRATGPAARLLLVAGLFLGAFDLSSVQGGVTPGHPGPGPSPALRPLVVALGQIDLTEEQILGVRAAFEARRLELQRTEQVVQDARDALAQAIYAAVYDQASIAAAAAVLGAAEGAAAVVVALTFQDVRVLLTQEQRDQLDALLNGILNGMRLQRESERPRLGTLATSGF